MTVRIGIIALAAMALLAVLLFSVPSFGQSTTTAEITIGATVGPRPPVLKPLGSIKSIPSPIAPLGSPTLLWDEAYQRQRRENAWRWRAGGLAEPPAVIEAPADVVIYRPLQRNYSKPYQSPAVHPGLRVMVDKQAVEHGWMGYNVGCPCNNCVRLRAAAAYFYRPRAKR